MRTKVPVTNRIERRLRIQVRRQKALDATPVSIRYVPLLLRRVRRCPFSLRWEVRVTEYQSDRPPTA